MDPRVEVWMPLGQNPNDLVGRHRFLTVVARLKPGVSIEQARSEMETIGDGLEHSDPALNTGWRPSLFPFTGRTAGRHAAGAAGVDGGLWVFCCLMACANVANLLLTRGAIRAQGDCAQAHGAGSQPRAGSCSN